MFRGIEQTKFTVQFGFVCDGGNTSGMVKPKEMRYSDLAFALAMVDPFNHGNWMERVESLGKRGDYMVIKFTSESDTHGTVGRFIMITRK